MDQRRCSHLPKPHLSHSYSSLSQMVSFKFSKLSSPTILHHRAFSKKTHSSAVAETPGTSTKPASGSDALQPKLLAVMPQDIIQEVFLHLDVQDVLSLAQVSRFFYAIAQSTDIWRNLAYQMLHRGRHVAVYDSCSVAKARAFEMRESIVTSSAAEQEWLRPYPKSVGTARSTILEDVELDHASYIMKFTSHTHLVLPTKGGRLVGWDLRTGERAGEYYMGPDTVLINVQGDYATRSLYWILGKMSSEIDVEQNLQLKLIRIQFPDPIFTSHPIIFEDLVDLVTPWSLAAEIHILDASQRMFCAVFEHGTSGTTGIHVVLDWLKGQSFIFDTGIPYAYGRSVTGLQLSEDKQHLILRSEHWSSEERRAFSIAYMRAHSNTWKSFRGLEKKELPLLPSVAISATKWVHDQVLFRNHTMTPHTVWVLPQYWPSIPGIPKLTSTIVLFFSCQETSVGTVRKWCAAQHYTRTVEKISQRLPNDEDDIKALDGAPCSPVRNVIEMKDPVLISLGHHGLPILAQSFNHLGWIEEAEDDSDDDIESVHMTRFERLLDGLRPRGVFSRLRNRVSGCRRPSSISFSNTSEYPPSNRRQLKLVTFPDPGEAFDCSNCPHHIDKSPAPRGVGDDCDCTTLKPVTLDVPPDILDRTYHMFLDSAAGTVTLATEDNELLEFRYGRKRASTNI